MISFKANNTRISAIASTLAIVFYSSAISAEPNDRELPLIPDSSELPQALSKKPESEYFHFKDKQIEVNKHLDYFVSSPDNKVEFTSIEEIESETGIDFKDQFWKKAKGTVELEGLEYHGRHAENPRHFTPNEDQTIIKDWGEHPSRGACLGSAVVCGGTVIGTGLACAAAIEAAAVSLGWFGWVTLPACKGALAADTAACGVTAYECTNYLNDKRHEENTDNPRSRTLHTETLGWSPYPYFSSSITCPDIHLIDRMAWRISNGRLSMVRIGCTDNRPALRPGMFGAPNGEWFSFTCGTGRTIGAVRVKHHNGRLTALRPFCKNATGDTPNWGWPSSSRYTNAFNNAQGQFSSTSCANGHNAGSVRVVDNPVDGTLDTIRLTCH